MFNLKNIFLILLSTLFVSGSAFAGPANKLNEDHLVKSYLVVAELAMAVFNFVNNIKKKIIVNIDFMNFL